MRWRKKGAVMSCRKGKRMRFLHLRYAVAVADTGSFTGAARKMFVSQPTVSAGVAEVERAVEFQIFTRTNTGAVLTPEGASFIKKARPVIAQMDLLEEEYVHDISLRG